MHDDAQLLRRYAEDGSESAFSEIVSRHIDLVYSAALRQVAGDTHLAQDLTQTVFADLARKARIVSRHGVLTGWLYHATRFAAAKAIRTERRRATREKKAAAMQELTSDVNWEQLRPVLDEAMSHLGAKDRDAVLLRYFERKELSAVGDALGTNEEAARKRLSRALEKLRRYLTGRGVSLSTATLATALTGSAAQAAPVTLAGTISTAVFAAAAAAAAGSTFNLLNLMSMTKLKPGLLSAAIVVGAGTPIVLQQQSVARLRAENRELRDQSRQLEQVRSENQRLARLRVDAEELDRLRQEVAELHRLRAEVARLRHEKEATARIEAENTRLDAHLKPLAADETKADLMNACLNNLTQIEGAKDQCALDHKLGTGSAVTADQISPYLKGGFENCRCPAGGQYTIAGIGNQASCDIHGSLQPPSELGPDPHKNDALARTRMTYAFACHRACKRFAEEHQGRMPDDIATALAVYPPVFNGEGVSPEQYEIVYSDKVSDLKRPDEIIMIREKKPWYNAVGHLVKAYVFADGHGTFHSPPDGNFEKWEQEHMAAGPAQ
jgi:RNA polymerase sigma factor (sigma-70 family)